MTKYTRLTGKLFGETATAVGDNPEIGQFGSALAGTYNGTTDVATIQGLSAWSKGFINAVTPNNQYPPLPEVTGALKVLSYQENYILQQGVPEWDANTIYYINNYASYGDKIYISKTDSNQSNNPSLDDGTNWKEYMPDLSPYAHISLDNLNSDGNSKLQYEPFSINDGVITDNKNQTLTYNGSNLICQPCTVTTVDGRVKKFTDSASFDCSTLSSLGIADCYVFRSVDSGALFLASTMSVGSSDDKNFVTPTLTDNGTMGGDSFAVSCTDHYQTFDAWKAFAGTGTGIAWVSNSLGSALNFYNPQAIKITKLQWQNTANTAYRITGFTFEGSDNGSTWTTIYTFNGEAGSASQVRSWDVNSTSYYKYHRIVVDSVVSSGTRGGIVNVKITGTYSSFSECAVATATCPATVSFYDVGTQQYVQNDDMVYIGIVSLDSGTITGVFNREINSCVYLARKNYKPMFEALMPDLTAPVSISGYSTTVSDFTAPSDGYVAVEVRRSNGSAQFAVDGRIIVCIDSNGTVDCWSFFYPVTKGVHTMRSVNATTTVQAFMFYPLKGATQGIADKYI